MIKKQIKYIIGFSLIFSLLLRSCVNIKNNELEDSQDEEVEINKDLKNEKYTAKNINNELYVSDLGFTLEYPKIWLETTLIENTRLSNSEYDKNNEFLQDEVFFLDKGIHENHNGYIFSIRRYYGDLIKDDDFKGSFEDLSIIDKGNGYTYVLSLPTEPQYINQDGEDNKRYLEKRKEIDNIIKTFNIIDSEELKNNKPYRRVGNYYFNFNLNNSYKLKESLSDLWVWEIYNNKDELIGEIEMLIYNKEYDNGILNKDWAHEIVKDEDKQRKLRISFDKNLQDDMSLILDSIQILLYNFSRKDVENILDTTLKLNGYKINDLKIINIDIQNNDIDKITFKNKDNMEESYSLDFPYILLKDNKSRTKTDILTWNLIDTISKEDQVFDIILNKNKEIKGIIEK